MRSALFTACLVFIQLGKTPIYYACSNGSLIIFRLLLQHGADLEIKSDVCSLAALPFFSSIQQDGETPMQQIKYDWKHSFMLALVSVA